MAKSVFYFEISQQAKALDASEVTEINEYISSLGLNTENAARFASGVLFAENFLREYLKD